MFIIDDKDFNDHIERLHMFKILNKEPMIDIGNDNLDNELNIEKYNMKMLKFRGSNNNVKHSILFEEGLNNHYVGGIDPYDDTIEPKVNIFKNGELIDLRTEEEIMEENKVYNPKELEYWRNIFPTKTDDELEEYIDKWGKENPKYLKFKNL